MLKVPSEVEGLRAVSSTLMLGPEGSMSNDRYMVFKTLLGLQSVAQGLCINP
jgi:hypothetical protein